MDWLALGRDVPPQCLLPRRLFVAGTEVLRRLTGFCFCDCRVYVIVERGHVVAQVGSKSYDLAARSVVDVFESGSMTLRMISPDAAVTGLVASTSFVGDSLKNLKVVSDSYILDRFGSPAMVFTGCECERVCSQLGLLARCLSEPGHHYRDELAQAYFKAFMLELGDILLSHEAEADERRSFGRHDVMAIEFLRLVHGHAASEHGVGFYADKLCVSAKHLSRVIASVTGKTPYAVIRDELLRHAFAMLEDGMTPVGAIAAELNFGDQSVFCKFFKRHTGLSPMEYRRRVRQNTV